MPNSFKTACLTIQRVTGSFERGEASTSKAVRDNHVKRVAVPLPRV